MEFYILGLAAMCSFVVFAAGILAVLLSWGDVRRGPIVAAVGGFILWSLCSALFIQAVVSSGVSAEATPSSLSDDLLKSLTDSGN